MRLYEYTRTQTVNEHERKSLSLAAGEILIRNRNCLILSTAFGAIPAVHPCVYLPMVARPFFLPELWGVGTLLLDIFFPLNILFSFDLEGYAVTRTAISPHASFYFKWILFSVLNVLFWASALAAGRLAVRTFKSRLWPKHRKTAILSFLLGITPLLYPFFYMPLASSFHLRPLYSLESAILDIFAPVHFVLILVWKDCVVIDSTGPYWPQHYWPAYYWRWIVFGLLNVVAWFVTIRLILLPVEFLRSRAGSARGKN